VKQPTNLANSEHQVSAPADIRQPNPSDSNQPAPVTYRSALAGRPWSALPVQSRARLRNLISGGLIAMGFQHLRIA
jgi:hypothetical protein